MMNELRISDIQHLIRWLEAMRHGTVTNDVNGFGEYKPNKFKITTYAGKLRVVHFSFILNWSYLTMINAVQRGMHVIIEE